MARPHRFFVSHSFSAHQGVGVVVVEHRLPRPRFTEIVVEKTPDPAQLVKVALEVVRTLVPEGPIDLFLSERSCLPRSFEPPPLVRVRFVLRRKNGNASAVARRALHEQVSAMRPGRSRSG